MDTLQATVTTKGQVTIPKRLRDQLGVGEGTILLFSVDHGVLIVRKEASRDPFDEWQGQGVLPRKLAKKRRVGSITDNYLRLIRDGSI